MTTYTMSASGPGEINEWLPSGASSVWEGVRTDDGVTAYAFVSATPLEGKRFTVAVSPRPPNLFVERVRVVVDGFKWATGGAGMYIGLSPAGNAVLYEGSLITTSGTFSFYTATWLTNPATGMRWSPNDIARFQPGAEANFQDVGESMQITYLRAEVDGTPVAPTSVIIQISGSGDFSEPNNGLWLEPVGLPKSKAARTSYIKIPNKDGGVFQWGGAEPRQISLRAVHLGDYDSAKTKEQALENLQWHTSSVSWRAVPLTLSVVLNGELKEEIPVVLNDYRYEQRQGRNNVYDFDLTFTRYND